MNRRFPLVKTLAFLTLFFGLASITVAQDFINSHVIPNSLRVIQIEEDWELSVGETDTKVTAPQVTTAISPQGDVSGLHAIFNINHQALDVFAPGGMQLQLWNGESAISYFKIRDGDVLAINGEAVRWTQRMSLNDGVLTFKIVNGTSETWNEFGDEKLLTAAIATEIPNLNLYDPHVSVNSSGTVFAGNRVDWLVLKRVRAFTADGQVFSINVDIDVDHE